MGEDVRRLRDFLDTVNPMWPLYWGRPDDGRPVEASKVSFELIKKVLDEWLEERGF